MDNNFNKKNGPLRLDGKNDFIRLNKKYKSLFVNGLTAIAAIYVISSLNSLRTRPLTFTLIVNIIFAAILAHATYKVRTQQGVIDIEAMNEARYSLIGVIIWEIVAIVINFFQIKRLEATILSDELFSGYSDYYTDMFASEIRIKLFFLVLVIAILSLVLYWQSRYENTITTNDSGSLSNRVYEI